MGSKQLEIEVEMISLLMLLFLQGAVSTYVPSVTYVSFQVLNTTDTLINTSNLIRSEIVITNSDDSPVVEVSLPFVFPYFGDFIDRIFISPNGFVQTSAAPLTSPYYTNPCEFTYDGVVAGYLTDLIVNSTRGAHISIVQSTEVTCVEFKGLNIYRREPLPDDYEFNFSICLYPDGKVSIDYESIVHLQDMVPATTASSCAWLSGLVSTASSASTGTARITEEQRSIQESVWETPGIGVYPSVYNDVQSNSKFVACPISTSWCAHPSVISNTTSYLNVTTLSLSCVSALTDSNSSIEIALQFANSSNLPNHVDLSRIAPCSLLNDNDDLTSSPVSLMCSLTSIDFSSPSFDVGAIYLHIVWKRLADNSLTSAYHFVGESIDPVELQLISSTSSSYNCSTNEDIGLCESCDVCNSLLTPEGLSCMSLVCPSNTDYITNASLTSFSSSPYLQSLYSSPSCTGNCSDTFIRDIDKNGVCCLVEKIDCLGVCDGGATGGFDADSGIGICCSPDEPPDCAGVCGGQTVVDTCYVCGGNDTGVLCPTGFEVDTGPNSLNSNNHLSTAYDATDSTYVSIVPIIIFNTFNTSVFVSIVEAESSSGKKYGPGFLLPQDVQEVMGYQNYTFFVKSNMSGIFSGHFVGWDVKTLHLRYVFCS